MQLWVLHGFCLLLIWLNIEITCEIQCNVCIRFAISIDRITPILTTVFLGWCSNCQCQGELITSGLFLCHIISRRGFLDGRIASEPTNLGTRISLQDALHDQKHFFGDLIFVLLDGGLLGEARRLASWDSKMRFVMNISSFLSSLKRSLLEEYSLEFWEDLNKVKIYKIRRPWTIHHPWWFLDS